ncbi:MAG: glycogen synthase GlgA [Candidatus Omnitrophica bacterium]|nr:glycogen synthase GlgA [Candidatus Omnitrophota bacterium]
MKIAFCSSESYPFAKTGGLGDVAGALPVSLAKQHHQVKVFIPFYKGIKPKKIFDNYGYTKQSGVEFYFIKNDHYFQRDGYYQDGDCDYSDNLERFTFFNKKVLELLKELDFSPKIIHCNDWQTSLISVYLKTAYSGDNFFKDAVSVLTIHNLAYQGLFNKDKYHFLGIPGQYFGIDGLEYYGQISFLKAGILFSDVVNTVSPTYAKQIQNKEYGCGLGGVLKRRRGSLSGILNAIDNKIWNPKTDNLIYKKYSKITIAEKAINKCKIQKDLGLKVDKNILLLGMVSRLTEQKGLDILSQSLDKVLPGCQIAILGVGDQAYHRSLKKSAKKYKGSMAVTLKFDEELAHRIYAGSDVFLVPSRFEPCGLSQMISYRYGTLPIVHETGGLADTVSDIKEGGMGFVFSDYSAQDLIFTIERARAYFQNKKKWYATAKRAMSNVFSWETTAKRYIDMYKSAALNKTKCERMTV